jgi:RNA polymerase sigma factor (sigma-70 family)
MRLLRLLRAETNHHDVERDAELRSELRSTLDAISRLSERERLLVGLRIAAGLSYAEVAAVTGMKENAARMATTRALNKVRHEVERHE